MLPSRNDEQPTQNGDGHLQLQVQKNAAANVKESNSESCEKLNQESGEENEVVPIVIRPGHIRFEPLGKGFLLSLYAYMFFCQFI